MRNLISFILIISTILYPTMGMSAGVVDGQPVNAATTNAAFLYKNGNDTDPYTLKVSNSTASTSTTTGAFQVVGGFGLGGAEYLGGKLVCSDTTDSSSSSTGSLITSGGIGAAKNIYAGGNINATGTVLGSNLSGTNTGDVTIGTFGSSPTANAASLSGQVLTFQPADGTHPGSLTSGSQTVGGAKTFSSAPTLSTMTIGSILFAGTGGLLSQDNNNLLWDAADARLAIGGSGVTPSAALDIHHNGNTLPLIQANNVGTQSSTGGGFIQVVHDSGAAMGSGNRLGSFQYAGAKNAGAGFLTGAAIDALTTQAWTAAHAGTSLSFYTTPNNSVTNTRSLLLDQDQSATFANTVTATIFVGALTGVASTATNLAGGSGGTIPYQSAAGTTAMLANGTAGQLLQSNGTTLAPTWVAAPTTSPLTTKGDLFGFSTVNARIPVGSDTQILTADSTQALGVKWAAPAGTGTSTPTANTNAQWDANKNMSANAFIPGVATTATAAGTTTLVVGSKQVQQFTGTSTQTVVLPDATTLANGQTLVVTNRSTGIVTVNTNGGALLQTMNPGANGSQATFTLISNGSTAGTWDVQYTNAGFIVAINPTVQKFTSGSGTYTTPAGVAFIRVKMVGGGAGGTGSGTGGVPGNGTAGNNTTFGTSLLTANGGSTGTAFGAGGAGGNTTISAPAIGTGITGSSGQAGNAVAASGARGPGGFGGFSPIFGGGGSTSDYSTNGQAGATNSGGGGQGGGQNAVAGGISGSGGGSGGVIDAIIPSPGATYSYVVGASASGGAAGTSGLVGGAGGSGYIEVTEYYTNVSVGTSVAVAAIQPTVQKLTSGSGATYTTPTGVQYIKIRLVGGGGGGGGGGTAGGTVAGDGGTTIFGTSLLSATGGSHGVWNGSGGSGGAGSITAPAIGTAITGNGGSSFFGTNVANALLAPTILGGASPFGGVTQGTAYNNAGGSAFANSGSGGNGGGNNGTTGADSGSAGGAGGYVEAIIPNPSATYTYTIGAAGSAGGAGPSGVAGGAGGSGYIEVTEFYSNFSVGTTASVGANTVLAGPTSGASAGPTFRSLVTADIPSQASEVLYSGSGAGAAGHGSVGTTTRRFTTQRVNTGSDITYTGSSSAGDIFTINTAGVYAATYCDSRSGGTIGQMGVTVNGANSTNVASQNPPVTRCNTNTFATGTTTNCCTAVFRAAVNDVVRAQDGGSSDATTDPMVNFDIVKTGN